MHRAGWARGLWLIRARLALLIASLVAVTLATVSLTAAGEPQDIGSIDVAGDDSASATYVPGETEDQRPTSGRVDPSVSPGTDEASEDRDASAEAPGGISGATGFGVPDVSRSSAQLRDSPRVTATPARLIVTSVDLDALLDATGVRDDGLMEIPDDGARAAWYRYGPNAGSGSGSVVLAGHVDTDEGLGAMAALREVSVGAEVEVEMSDGSVLTYEVRGRETIAKNELPSDEIFARTGPERLTLITCGGPWRAAESSYRDNVVVVATPMDQR